MSVYDYGERGVANKVAIRASITGFVCGAAAAASVLLGEGHATARWQRAGGGLLLLGLGAGLAPQNTMKWIYGPGAFLGTVFGTGVAVMLRSEAHWNFGAYMMRVFISLTTLCCLAAAAAAAAVAGV